MENKRLKWKVRKEVIDEKNSGMVEKNKSKNQPSITFI